MATPTALGRFFSHDATRCSLKIIQLYSHLATSRAQNTVPMPLPIPTNPEWPSDVAGTDAESCKVAGEFFATWMTTPEQIDAGIYRGPGLVVTAGYLRVLLGSYAQQYSDADLAKLFFELQVRAEENDPSFSYQAFIDDFIQPAVSACGGSVCKSLGWGGNSDLAGIGVSGSIRSSPLPITDNMAISTRRSCPPTTSKPSSQQSFSSRSSSSAPSRPRAPSTTPCPISCSASSSSASQSWPHPSMAR